MSLPLLPIMNSQIGNHESMLRESIKHFLTSYQGGSSDFSSFESIFFRLIQTMLDPPLEITWFYSAVTYHAAKSSLPHINPAARVVIAKDLLSLLTSCSKLSSTSKKISLLAPVVYELYNIVNDYRKTSVRMGTEVDSLVDNVIGYTLMCAGFYDYGTGVVELDNMTVCFEDLVRVWTADRGGGNCNFAENLKVFFPFLTDGVWNGMNARCGVRELSGIILCEVFFLRVYLSFEPGSCTEELLKDAVVQTIKGFRNFYFLEKIGSSPTPQNLCNPSFRTRCPNLFSMTSSAMNSVNGQNLPTSYDDLIENSVRCFLVDYPRSSSNSVLLSEFKRLILALKDPPLEIIWFYAVLKFHSPTPNLLLPPEKFFVAEELFKFLKSCSSSCTVVKKVAVVAPVLYFLYHLDLKFSAKDSSLREEIRILVDEIVRYVSVCCSQYLERGGETSDGSGVNIFGLVRVWTTGEVRGNCNADALAAFFPTTNKEFQHEVDVCLGNLAGAVMCEALFMRLYLNVSNNKEDLQKHMLNLAIQTIKGFHSFYFTETLLKTLLEPSLPSAALLCSEDEVPVRKALYDAVIVEYSFYSGRQIQSADNQSKRLALLWVLVADRAIQFARATSDQVRAILYIETFRESQIVSALINLATSQGGILELNIKPNFSSPKAFIRWLLALENQGVRVFEHTTSMIRLRALMLESMETGSPQCKKRKDGLSDLQEVRTKHTKFDPFGSSMRGKFSPLSNDTGVHCGVEFNNAASEDYMEL